MMRHLLKIKFALLLALLIPVLAQALTSDRNQPINIEADHAQMDDKEGVTQYKGNAILTQGTLRIEGDIITFYFDQNKELTKAIAQGKLAKYKQIQKQGEEPVRAKALQMEYHAKTQKIYLLGQGHVWQNGNESSGNQIEYDITKNLVIVNSAPVKVNGETQKSGRVHVIIQPTNKNQATSIKAPENKKVSPPSKVDVITPAPAEQASSSKYPSARVLTILNVRTGPGANYTKISVLRTNDEVIILTKQKQWAQVRAMVDGEVIIGWVHQKFLAEKSN